MIASTLALGFGLSAAADVWKYVDPQGQVQYSDRWVPGSELIKGERNHPSNTPSDESKKLKDASGQISDQLTQQATQRAVQKDVTAARSEQCKQARDHYQKTIEARRIFRTGKDGEREYLTDDEADQERLRSRTDMEQVCGAGAASSSSSS
jgi:Skp family chaperone for outer membrane proteins